MSTVMFNIIAVLVIVAAGSFAVVLVSDLVLLIISPKSNGAMFHPFKKSKQSTKEVQPETKPETVEKQPEKSGVKIERLEKPLFETEKTVKQSNISAPNMPTITPFLQDKEDGSGDFMPVDFDKAVEEQKMLQNKLTNQTTAQSVTEKPLFSTTIQNGNNLEFDEESEEDEQDEEEITEIIEEVQNKALLEVEEESKKQTVIEKELSQETPEVVAPFTPAEDTKQINKIKPKIIYKTVQITQAAQEKAEDKELTPDEEKDFNELRKIREDIFNLRVSAFKDLKTSKTGVVSKEKQQEVVELEQDIREKLSELESLKQYQITAENEKQILIKTNQEVTEEKNQLTKEVETLEKELEQLKNTVGIVDKPFYSKEYYEGVLADLEVQLADAEKELRLNKREYNPLKRIKRTFDRDMTKLKRKEMTVAKQQVRVYGVNNAESLDTEKVQKLQSEVDLLNKLKESVRSCEVILKQNKERYPILEKANKLYTKHVETLKKDIAAVLKALEYYNQADKTEVVENTENANNDHAGENA